MLQLDVRDFAQWRVAARDLLTRGVDPGEVSWSDWRSPALPMAQPSAPPSGAQPSVAPSPAAKPPVTQSSAAQPSAAQSFAPSVLTSPPVIPQRLLRMLQLLACYRDASRWELMYRLSWRVVHEGRWLLEDAADPDISVARSWEKAIRQDLHKMEAFVRFHETTAADGRKSYLAWFEPAHEILQLGVPFFEKRFPNMDWMIATPDGAAIWNGTRTEFVAPPSRAALPRADSTHPLWRVYYRSVCNVARISPEAMQRHMPQRYWQHLPEASEIPALIANGQIGVQRALEATPREDDLRIPRGVGRALERIAPGADSPLTCQRCDLWRHATQAVPGEGPPQAKIMLVGEQPGDEEDLRGRAFVGPAGQLLNEVIARAGMQRNELFVTNSVKHFKWEPRGKRRLHKRPDTQEVHACRTWLFREIESVTPRVIVALGSTAMRALLGSSAKVEDARQLTHAHPSGAVVVATYHPAAILRTTGDRQRALREALELDLKTAADLARTQG